MKDDPVERIAAELLSLGWFPTRHRESALSAAERVLAIARPAILEEAVAKVQHRHDAISNTEACRACCRNVIRDLRALAHTTGQEG